MRLESLLEEPRDKSLAGRRAAGAFREPFDLQRGQVLEFQGSGDGDARTARVIKAGKIVTITSSSANLVR
jgi:hypothetical protein